MSPTWKLVSESTLGKIKPEVAASRKNTAENRKHTAALRLEQIFSGMVAKTRSANVHCEDEVFKRRGLLCAEGDI